MSKMQCSPFHLLKTLNNLSMKSIITGAVALFALPLSVSAGQILPNLYAREYCDARSMGMSAHDSRVYAVDRAYISSGNPQTVTLSDGTTATTDVIAAVKTAARRCPQYFK